MRVGEVRRWQFKRCRFVAVLLVGASLIALPASPAAKAAPAHDAVATKTRCAPGTYPVLLGGGKRLKVRRGASGRLRCQTTVKRSKPVAPASGVRLQLGRVADQLETAVTVIPSALKPLEKRLGRRRAKALVDAALHAWRQPVGAAALARAHASADSTNFQDSPFGKNSTTFGKGEGVSGKVDFELKPPDNGGQLGFSVKAAVEVTANREELGKLGKDLAAKLPADIQSATARVSVSFQDAPQDCPSASGEVPGRVKAKATITVTLNATSGPSQLTMSAEADMTYKAKVGDDGHWTSIDDVDMTTAFSKGGSGEPTRTYRGHRLGDGFGRDSILGSKDFGKSLTRDWNLIDAQKGGGIFGPMGGWNWKRGVSLGDFHTIENVKAMVYTWVATDALLLSGVEYLRGIALDRGEKYWYTDERCVKLDATAPSEADPSQVVPVTLNSATAGDGKPLKVDVAASGTASITPPTAAHAPGTPTTFNLTVPAERGSNGTWKLVATGKGGKKTAYGSVKVRDTWPPRVKVTLSSVSEFDPADPGTKRTWSGSFVADLQTQYSGAATAEYLTQIVNVQNWLEVVGPDVTGCIDTSVEFSGAVSPSATGTSAGRVRLRADAGGAHSYSMWASFVAAGLINETRVCPDHPPELLDTQPQGVAGSGALNLTMDPLPAVRPYTGTFPIVDSAQFTTPLSGTVDVKYTIEPSP